ncbi:ANTAR domain-containing protein [Streptomyces sp. NPDC050504]|uniref:ANTAR domain-containing protein n=1 Tax=Streptomyces sp. NPDC050504 TaxID=3365618 RepID=UPI0037A67875
MTPPLPHEQPAAPALLDLVDASLRDEDGARVLQRLTQLAARLPGVDAASCSLADHDGHLLRTAASSTAAHQLERLQDELREGPCLDSRLISKPLTDVPITHPHSRVRWPRFTPSALKAGFAAVTALPIRHDQRVWGSLNLYHRHGALLPADVREGQLLATATAICLLHQDSLRASQERERQLRTALDSRVLIEQAKGILSERLECSVTDAFDLLRRHARSNRMKLVELAHVIVHSPPGTGPFPRDRSR